MTTSQTVDFLKAIKKESGLLLGRRDLLMLEAAVARRTDCRNRGDRNDLLEQLTSDPSGRGLSHLIAELAPGVTGFFRDREHFDFIARFLRNRAAETTSAPRLWSAGCSTGEEVYSLAMTLHPLLGEIGLKTEILGWRASIFPWRWPMAAWLPLKPCVVWSVSANTTWPLCPTKWPGPSLLSFAAIR
jgi:chemotaxis protein methyltransferase CheR